MNDETEQREAQKTKYTNAHDTNEISRKKKEKWLSSIDEGEMK